jgi:hypothetical protein
VLDYALADQVDMVRSAKSAARDLSDVDVKALLRGSGPWIGGGVLAAAIAIGLRRRRRRVRAHPLAAALEAAVARAQGARVFRECAATRAPCSSTCSTSTSATASEVTLCQRRRCEPLSRGSAGSTDSDDRFTTRRRRETDDGMHRLTQSQTTGVS